MSSTTFNRTASSRPPGPARAASGAAAAALVDIAFFGEQKGTVKTLALVCAVGGDFMPNLGGQ
jgi:multidrug transporter EmrE-like cation transporter